MFSGSARHSIHMQMTSRPRTRYRLLQSRGSGALMSPALYATFRYREQKEKVNPRRGFSSTRRAASVCELSVATILRDDFSNLG